MQNIFFVSRADFFFGIGLAVIFVQIPFIFLIMNSNGATVMPAWNWPAITIIFLVNYIIAPVLFNLLLSLTNLFSAKIRQSMISFAIAFLIVTQICFYLFPSLSNVSEAIVILTVLPFITVPLYLMHRHLILIIGATGLTFPISLACFLLVGTPTKIEGNFSNSATQHAGHRDVIIITAEKLTSAFMLDKNGTIRDDFPNLQKLATKSNLYTNLHTRTIHTAGGLDAVLLGEIATNATPMGIRQFRGRDILATGSLVDFYSAGRKVHVYNDYTGERYCDPKKHHCVKVFDQASVGSSIKLTSAFYWEYLDSMLPKGLLAKIKKKHMAFFEDIVLIGEDPMKYPEMQFNRFLEDLENAESPVLMVMHTFMTDGGFAGTPGYSVSDLSEAESQKWERTKVFDNYIGLLINKLEQKGRLNESLFLIVSDTGSDVASMFALTEPKTMAQEYNENLTKIFTILHHPTQKKGVVFKDRLFQEDIFQIMTEEVINTKMHNVKNAQQIYLQAKSSLGTRTFNLNEETGLLQLEE